MAEADARNLSDAHTEQPSLSGRKAVVTGGTTGIGRAIAMLLAAEGAKDFVCGRTPDHLDDALERTARSARAMGSTSTCRARTTSRGCSRRRKATSTASTSR